MTNVKQFNLNLSFNRSNNSGKQQWPLLSWISFEGNNPERLYKMKKKKFENTVKPLNVISSSHSESDNIDRMITIAIHY